MDGRGDWRSGNAATRDCDGAAAARGFGEDGLVGRRLRIGAQATVAVADRDPRREMVMLDPDTAKQDPMVLRGINRSHENAGVYGAVPVEGTVRPGDEIVLTD